MRKKRKKRGRPVTTGPGVQIGLRWHKPLLDQVRTFAKDRGIPVSEAVRALVNQGLKRGATLQ